MTGSVHKRVQDRSEKMAPLLIAAVVILGYGLAPTRLPLCGEETCRALHGIEMARTGDWLVATNQGIPILDRPPLQYWMLATIHAWVHPLDPLTLRLFMAAVVLCTSLVIWWYARAFLSPAGAFLAAVAYPTMGHVLELGRRAETDGLFTLLLAAALFAWHYGYTRRWQPARVWAVSGVLAALATLTKGLQGPVAFFGTVYLFLLVRGDGRYLLRRAHVLGLALFAGTIAVWQVPFYLEAGWEGARLTWLDPCTSRVQIRLIDLLRHLTEFPLSVLGATLPWSALLAGLFCRSFWRPEPGAQTAPASGPAESKHGELALSSSVLPVSTSCSAMRSAIVFALLGMATVFAPVWLSEGGLRRYVMPMYPLLAVVCGAVAQQALAAPIDRFLRQFWRYYLRVMAVVLAGFVVPFLAATVMRTFSNAHWTLTLGQPWPLMIALAAGTAGGVVFLVRQTAPNRTEHGLLATATIAALLAACYNGPLLNAGIEKLVNLEPQILALRRSLPANARLVSFGPVFHRFLYWYGGSIPIMDLPQTVYDVPDDLEYFAMDVRWDQTPDLPFAWQRLAQFDMNPRCSAHPVHLVVVGRRIPTSGDPADLPADTRRQTSPAAMQ